MIQAVKLFVMGFKYKVSCKTKWNVCAWIYLLGILDGASSY